MAKQTYLQENPFQNNCALLKKHIKLGAIGVGYTIYIGSKYENEMFQEFDKKYKKKLMKKGLL
jgi:DhnA family fructose-bisphosphate aldolase class Ia